MVSAEVNVVGLVGEISTLSGFVNAVSKSTSHGWSPEPLSRLLAILSLNFRVSILEFSNRLDAGDIFCRLRRRD